MDLVTVERCVEVVSEVVACLMTTSSCTSSRFAPGGCDALIGVSKFCKQQAIPHIINTAHGVPSAFICH